MNSNSEYRINLLKQQIKLIEESEIKRKEELESTSIDYNLKLLNDIILKRKHPDNENYKVYGRRARDNDITKCLSNIYTILKIIRDDVKIIKESHV